MSEQELKEFEDFIKNMSNEQWEQLTPSDPPSLLSYVFLLRLLKHLIGKNNFSDAMAYIGPRAIELYNFTTQLAKEGNLDEELYHKVIESVVEVFDKFNQYQCDCVIYGFEKVLSDGERLYATHDMETYFSDKRLLCKTLFFNHIYNSLCRKAVKAQLITPKNYGALERVQMGEDLLQSLEILRVCKTAVLIPDILYRYMVNNTSITQSIYAKPLSLSFDVQMQVLRFLQQEKIFTPQDMQEYHDYCLTLFQQQIKTICSHPGPYHEKMELFKRIKKHPYYTDFLISATYKQRWLLFYTQFRLGLFWLLLLEGRIHSFWKRRLLKRV